MLIEEVYFKKNKYPKMTLFRKYKWKASTTDGSELSLLKTRLKSWARTSYCTQVSKAVTGLKRLLLSKRFVAKKEKRTKLLELFSGFFLRQGATPG